MGKRYFIIFIFCYFFIPGIGLAQDAGMLSISFSLEANGSPILLRDTAYKNSFGETYTINKLKCYAGQWQFNQQAIDKYLLVNAATEENKIDFSLPAGHYPQFSFLLGVDSMRNCSGAQDGALDPMNDMFWTWNSGYIMFKLEGNSLQSAADLNRIEWHIGGYKGPLNATRRISFQQPFEVASGKTTEIHIVLNLDKIWDGKNKIKISEDPMCMTMGTLAQKIADNFPGLFSIRNLSQPQ